MNKFADTQSASFNLKENYSDKPKSLSEAVRNRRLKLTDTLMGPDNQMNEETLMSRVEKDDKQRDL